MPTLESGKSTNEDVEVKAGDKVMDADGNVVELAAGMMVNQRRGRDGGVHRRSDHDEAADRQLRVPPRPEVAGWRAAQGRKTSSWAGRSSATKSPAPPPSSPATRPPVWHSMALTFTRTELPGEQDPLYLHLTDFYPFPAHRVLSDGRMLKDVPAKEYATLPEIAERPWGFGPYMIKEWVKGEKMVLEAHPYWFGGTPAIPQLRHLDHHRRRTPKRSCSAGQVDILDSDDPGGRHRDPGCSCQGRQDHAHLSRPAPPGSTSTSNCGLEVIPQLSKSLCGAVPCGTAPTPRGSCPRLSTSDKMMPPRARQRILIPD